MVPRSAPEAIGEKGSDTKNAKHPSGRSGFWCLTPFRHPHRKRTPRIQYKYPDPALEHLSAGQPRQANRPGFDQSEYSCGPPPAARCGTGRNESG